MHYYDDPNRPIGGKEPDSDDPFSIKKSARHLIWIIPVILLLYLLDYLFHIFT